VGPTWGRDKEAEGRLHVLLLHRDYDTTMTEGYHLGTEGRLHVLLLPLCHKLFALRTEFDTARGKLGEPQSFVGD
jgi:hypothetical protein